MGAAEDGENGGVLADIDAELGGLVGADEVRAATLLTEEFDGLLAKDARGRPAAVATEAWREVAAQCVLLGGGGGVGPEQVEDEVVGDDGRARH